MTDDFQEDDFAPDTSDDFQEDDFQPETTFQPMTLGGLARNAATDIKDIGGSVPAIIKKFAGMPKQMLIDTPSDLYQSGKQIVQGQPFMGTPVGQQLQQLGTMVKSLPQNILHPYEHPVKAALDIGSIAMPVSSGLKGATTAIAQRYVPPLLKAMKGVPTNATRMAMEDPTILNLPGTSASIQGKSQSIIDAIKEANAKVGNEFRGAYSEQGLVNPVDQIISSPSNRSVLGTEKAISSKLNFEDLRSDYHNAMSGDLFKKRNAGGGEDIMSSQQQLEALTDLKRALQDKAIYPPAGQQLSPSQGAYNAAIKKMASDIDELRGTLPGGEKLALADGAYSEMAGLKGQLISAFKDPYTGRDYLNRILKGDVDWLTSGRLAGKVGAIERIEQLTGKSVLKPALKEMAAAYLKNPDTMGLPSFGFWKSLASVIPTKMFIKAGQRGAPKSMLKNSALPTITAAETIGQASPEMQVLFPDGSKRSVPNSMLKNTRRSQSNPTLRKAQ